MPCETIFDMAGIIRWVRSILPVCRPVFHKLALVWVVFIFASSLANAARLDADIAGLCDRAAIRASRDKGVPLDVLRAISRSETGRPVKSGLQPWPWTVNMEGAGHWFATLDEARAFVFLHFKNGARSFDVGCFQINYKWHGVAFRSIDDMFDPVLNAQYAAEFLIDLYQEFGSWADAAGAYHSRTPEFAKKYTARFDRIRAGLSGETEAVPPYREGGLGLAGRLVGDLNQASGPRPLLREGTVAFGSLVPIVRQANAGTRPFVVFK